jgi:hypothetical protein
MEIQENVKTGFFELTTFVIEDNNINNWFSQLKNRYFITSTFSIFNMSSFNLLFDNI